MEKKKLDFDTGLLFGIFSAGIVLILPLRVYQYLNIIESGTGFYEKTDFSVVLMYVLLAVFCGAMFIFSLSRKNTALYIKSAVKKPVLGILSFFAAATLIMDAITQFGNFSNLYYGSGQISGYIVNEASGSLMKSGALPLFFEALFAVLAALFFIISGINFFKAKSDGSEYKLLALTPLAWSICRILHRFMRTISFIKVSDLFFELFMLVFLMLFFVTFAQLVSRINHTGTDWKLFAYGLPAALFCLLCFVPRFAMQITGRGDILADQSPPEYCDFAVALFIIAFLISKACISGRRKQV